MDKDKKPSVLVGPLEWGLGHATRLSAIISKLEAKNWKIYIAADGLPYNFLSQQFPDLTHIRLPFTSVRYTPSKKGFFMKLLWQLPSILRAIRRTRKTVKHLVAAHEIDLIIADNRYGFTHKTIPSVFITHQLRPRPPALLSAFDSLFFRWVHQHMIKDFDYWWVPDYAGEVNVCGRLSHLPWQHKKIRHIDPVSWLTQFEPNPHDPSPEIELLFLLSGPEPQRSLLEQQALEILIDAPYRSVILQGLPHPVGEKAFKVQQGNCLLYNHLPGPAIAHLLRSTPKIVCRAGVVTVFDLVALGLPALLIPSPGQTEQEYVVKKLSREGFFDYCDQQDLTAERIEVFRNKSFKSFPKPDETLQDQVIAELASHLPI